MQLIDKIYRYFLKLWLGPLPDDHLLISNIKLPEGVIKKIVKFVKHLIIHPTKRRIAKYYLWFLKFFFGLKVVAVTGSAGKTTTKEAIASVLSQKGNTIKSRENIDPVYNIPSTILKCLPSTKYLVLEMGVEYPGEMEFYTWLAKPDVAIITNIFPTHLKYFGDIKGVKKEKIQILKYLSKDNYAIIKRSDKNLPDCSKSTKSKIIWYGNGSDIYAEDLKYEGYMGTIYTLSLYKSKINVRIPIIGRQYVENTLAAAIVGYIFKVDLKEIKQGLEMMEIPEHRMDVVRSRNGALIFDDTYNSNPAAVKSTIKDFTDITNDRKRIIIFGDMLELGSDSIRYHKQIGKYIAGRKIDKFVSVGDHSKATADVIERSIGKKNVYRVNSEVEVDPILNQFLSDKYAILVKGSRSIALDKLIDRLS